MRSLRPYSYKVTDQKVRAPMKVNAACRLYAYGVTQQKVPPPKGGKRMSLQLAPTNANS